MYYRSSFLFAFILILSFRSSNTAKSLSDLQKYVHATVNYFSVNLYKILGQKQQANFVCSPLGLHMLILMTIYGTDDFRKLELSSPSNLSNDEKYLLYNLYQWLAPNVKIHLASKLFIHQQFSMKSIQQLTQLFKSEIGVVNFQKTFSTARSINNWSKEKTNNKITNLVSADDLKNMQLAMVSSAYFEGNWLYPFNYLQNRTFHLSKTDSVIAVMMCDTAPYNYGSIPNIDAQYIELPYESEDAENLFSMYIIIPNEIDGVDAINDKLHNIDFAALNAPKKNVDVYIPKFKLENKVELTLDDMAIGEGIMDDISKRAYQHYSKISKIIQKSFINVDVKGSESSYATILEVTLTKEATEINADRPFIAVIVEKVRNIHLIWARINNPLQ